MSTLPLECFVMMSSWLVNRWWLLWCDIWFVRRVHTCMPCQGQKKKPSCAQSLILDYSSSMQILHPNQFKLWVVWDTNSVARYCLSHINWVYWQHSLASKSRHATLRCVFSNFHNFLARLCCPMWIKCSYSKYKFDSVHNFLPSMYRCCLMRVNIVLRSDYDAFY